MSPEVKGKRRVVQKTYFNTNILFLMQVYERNFKSWWTVAVTSDQEYANNWKKCFTR